MTRLGESCIETVSGGLGIGSGGVAVDLASTWKGGVRSEEDRAITGPSGCGWVLGSLGLGYHLTSWVLMAIPGPSRGVAGHALKTW